MLLWAVIGLAMLAVVQMLYSDKIRGEKTATENLLELTQDNYNQLSAEKREIEKRLSDLRISEDTLKTILRELVRLERIREVNPDEYERCRRKAWAIAFHHAEQSLNDILVPAVLFPTLGSVVEAQKKQAEVKKALLARAGGARA